MDSRVEFTVLGVPVPQPRPRFVRAGGGVRAVSNRGHVAAWKEAVKLEAQLAMAGREPLAGPLALVVVFVLPRPLYRGRTGPRAWHDKRPDTDNLLKALKDALAEVCFADDGQVCAERVYKVVAAGGEQPRAQVLLFPAEPQYAPVVGATQFRY